MDLARKEAWELHQNIFKSHNLAIEVVGQNWSCEVISLFLPRGRAGGIKLPLATGLLMPRNEGCM